MPKRKRAVGSSSFGVHASLRLFETVPQRRAGSNCHRRRKFYRAIVPDRTVRVVVVRCRFYPFVACLPSFALSFLFSRLLTHSSLFFLSRGQIQAVSFPDVHVKRFTDDGKYLVCFSRDLCEVVTFRYRSVSSSSSSCSREEEEEEEEEETYIQTKKNSSNNKKL